MLISLVVAAYFTWAHDAWGMPHLEPWQKLVWGTSITTAGWLFSAFVFPPSGIRCFEHLSKKPGCQDRDGDMLQAESPRRILPFL